MKDFRDLHVWEKAHHVVLDLYRVTAEFPQAERYGLTSQMRRAAISIPSNIAEGCGRRSDADFARFLQIALGSASELECQTLLARDLGFLDGRRSHQLIEGIIEVKRMISGLLRRLRAQADG